MRMYRTAKWKLIRDFLDPGRDELYDLEADPAEMKNLVQSKDPRVQRARAELHGRILQKMKDNQDTVADR